MTSTSMDLYILQSTISKSKQLTLAILRMVTDASKHRLTSFPCQTQREHSEMKSLSSLPDQQRFT